MAFADTLKKLMDVREMKAVDLARATGLSEAAISGYLKGTKEPRGKQSVEIAKALNVPLDILWETDFAPYLLGIDTTKTSPEPAATDSEDEKEKDEIVKVLTEGLSRLGFLDKDGMISDRDFKFLCSLVDLMLAHFNQGD